jgi:subtilase family protein/pro-kumamolisin-like protein
MMAALRPLTATALCGLAVAAAFGSTPASASSAGAGPAAKAGAGKMSTAVIGLRRRQAALASFAMSRATPGTAAYRDYASVGSLARTYGATGDTWQRVRRYLRGEGIHARLDATRGFATAKVSRRQRRSAFPPPRRLRGLIGPVLFASSSAQQRPRVAPTRPHVVTGSGTPKRTGTPSGCQKGVGTGGFTPNQYRTAYGVDPQHASGLFGQGTRIAFVEIDGFSQTILDRFARCFGFTAPQPAIHLVGLGDQLPPGTETSLDTEIAAAIAPRARMDVFQSNGGPANLIPLFAAPLDAGTTAGPLPDVISASLGYCEPQFGRPAARLLDYVLAMAAGAGITVVGAAGDDGSSACFSKRLAVAYPGSSGFLTSVGGTRLTLTSGNRTASEVVWNDFPFGSARAGGGGTSRLVHRPDYQSGHPGGFSFRKVPDVAFHSSGFPGYAILTDQGWQQVDGTSAAAPLLGAGAALAVQAASRAGEEPPGLLNPLIYEAARNGSPGLVNDVTMGDNDLFRLGCCTARQGYDRASGWGSVNLAALTTLVVASGP